jgi:hypothetical protein
MTIEFGKEIKDNAKDVGEESKEAGKQSESLITSSHSQNCLGTRSPWLKPKRN